MVHITGGGFYENIPRALPDHMGVEVNGGAWEMPTIFRLLQEWGNVDWTEMYRTFNMGIGMILIVSPKEAARVESHLQNMGEAVYRIGHVTEGAHDVVIKGGVFDA
jgi:phosphoribosylformylglycinamidine cyclo-ligase